MIIEKNYKRNKNNEIIKRQIVEVQCDKCEHKWETAYSNRKRKILDIDLCHKCRVKMAWSKSTIANISVSYNCTNCGIEKRKLEPKIAKHNFCSLACRDEYFLKKKYSHLQVCFEANPNEVAYLFGLILGDGHLKKHAKKATRISIAFDVSGKWGDLLSIAKTVMDKLQISWFEEPKSHKSCQMIGFVLPDYLLEKYSLLFSGNKFSAQPYPSEEIIKNINYVSGLLNSDGSYTKRGAYSTYSFYNTTVSIINSFSKCLTLNEIHHTRFEYDGRLDIRTGNVNKRHLQINIADTDAVAKLHSLTVFKMKGNLLETPIGDLKSR